MGSETFMVDTYPGVHFDSSSGSQEYWRRQHISLKQGLDLISRATLPRSIGLQQSLRGGSMTSRYSQGPPNVSVLGETPGSFPARDWTVDEGRALVDADVDNSRSVCVPGRALWPGNCSPTVRQLEKKSISADTITRSSACWKPTAPRKAACRTISPSFP